MAPRAVVIPNRVPSDWVKPANNATKQFTFDIHFLGFFGVLSANSGPRITHITENNAIPNSYIPINRFRPLEFHYRPADRTFRPQFSVQQSVHLHHIAHNRAHRQ